MTASGDIQLPNSRRNFLAAPGFESQLAQTLNAGALANGWLIAGGEGAGKATLSYRLARALLWRARPSDSPTLDVPDREQASMLVASGAHPDLFVAERQFDDKKERLKSDIAVETVRDLTHFLNHTPSMGGWRVAIIDTADDLNRSSANALLKALEEPPPRTAIFVLSAAPGRLLATIRSRCRRIDLRPLPDETIAHFLEAEGAADGLDAQRIAHVAGGRPGYALSLALGDGGEAIDAIDTFWTTATQGGDVAPIAQRLAGKDAEGVFDHFQTMLLSRISRRAKALAFDQNPDARRFVTLGETVDRLFQRGAAVNLDRAQMVLAAGRAFKLLSP
jgi:DNA polymerase-3 subunit delta'